MAQEWKTPRREPACRACERAFADGEAHFSSLAVQEGELLREDLCLACWRVRRESGEQVPAESPGPVREPADPGGELDAGTSADPAGDPGAPESQASADAVERAPESDGEPAPAAPAAAARVVLVWWRTRHEAERKRKLALDVDLLEQLFRSLSEREEQNLRELRYLLCLLLMRKRRLKVARVLRAGEEGAESESFLCRRPRTGEEFLVPVFDFTPERTEELREELRSLLDGVDPDDVEAGADEDAADEDAHRGEPDSEGSRGEADGPDAERAAADDSAVSSSAARG